MREFFLKVVSFILFGNEKVLCKCMRINYMTSRAGESENKRILKDKAQAMEMIN